jgi:hypothetical protein
MGKSRKRSKKRIRREDIETGWVNMTVDGIKVQILAESRYWSADEVKVKDKILPIEQDDSYYFSIGKKKHYFKTKQIKEYIDERYRPTRSKPYKKKSKRRSKKKRSRKSKRKSRAKAQSKRRSKKKRSRKSKRKSKRRSKKKRSRKSKRKSKRRSKKRRSKRRSRKSKRKSKRRSKKSKASSGCKKQNTKKYALRGSPPFPANKCQGKKKKGNDGRMYKSVANKNGIHAWKKA